MNSIHDKNHDNSKKFHHLTLDDRIEIQNERKNGKTITQIAKNLGKSKSTISREIRRNSQVKVNTGPDLYNNPNKIVHYNSEPIGYTATGAQGIYEARKKNSHKPYVLTDDHIKTITYMLKKGLSPELIAGRVQLERHWKIHFETIYRYIYSGDSEENLSQYLPWNRKTRRKRSPKKKAGMRHIPNRTSIHERPEEVNSRESFGNWEADSVVSGRVAPGGLHTLVERMTRFAIVTKIDSTSCHETIKKQLEIVNTYGETSIKSITYDNGIEFARHYKLTEKYGIKTYFAEPYSSWQRGTNENFNGRIRKFYPKKTDFSKIPEGDIQEVVDYWNNRPMKVLGFRTPAEAFEEELLKLKLTA